MGRKTEQQGGVAENGVWYLTKEQAAQAALVVVLYPDGVFGYTANGMPDREVSAALRRISDHVGAGAVVEARTDL